MTWRDGAGIAPVHVLAGLSTKVIQTRNENRGIIQLGRRQASSCAGARERPVCVVKVFDHGFLSFRGDTSGFSECLASAAQATMLRDDDSIHRP